jgi:large subunit ribosomal protein L32
MAVPKKKTSRMKRGMRRAHKRAAAPTVVHCPRCGEPRVPHHACPSCGFYRQGVEVPVGQSE